MNETENDREYKVIDMLLSSHSMLRDKLERRATLLNLGLLAISIVLNGFVFATDEFFRAIFGDHIVRMKFGMGLTSIAVLVLSIIQFTVDWAGRAREHRDAVSELGRLKLRYREAFSSGDISAHSHLTAEYKELMKELPPIPEKEFLKLKSAHQLKRTVSAALDRNPGVPVMVISTRLRWRAILSYLKDKS